MANSSPTRRIDSLPDAAKSGIVKVRDAIKLVERDGWRLNRTRGSHRHFKHSTKPGIVTIAGHPNVDIPRGTLNSVLKQAGLKNQ